MGDQTPSLDEIYFAVLERDTSKARASYLDDVCGCGSEIRRRVELLLEFGSHLGSFLEEPAWVPQPPLISQVADPQVVQAGRAGKGVLRKVFCRVGEAELGSAQPTEPTSLASVGCTHYRRETGFLDRLSQLSGYKPFGC